MESTTVYTKSFLRDSYLFSLATRIAVIRPDAADTTLLNVLMHDTIFHPQGGGQPSDVGFIETRVDESVHQVPVKKLIYDREKEQIWHQVSSVEGADLKEDQEVRLQIDEAFRRQNAKLHSAGHLIDMGVNKMGYDWEAGKGYHFSDGPYVEYVINTWEEGTPEKLKAFLNDELNKMIAASGPTDPALTRVFKYADAKKEIPNLPGYLPEGGDVRWVKLNSVDVGCPCGGTHIQNISDLTKITVTKIQKKGKKVKVSYAVE